MPTLNFPINAQWQNNVERINALYDYSFKDTQMSQHIWGDGEILSPVRPDMRTSSDVGIVLAEIINGDK